MAERRHLPASVLTGALVLNAVLAAALSGAEAVLLMFALDFPDGGRYPEAAAVMSVFVFIVLLAPGFCLLSVGLSSASWLWHASSENPRAIWPDALVGIASGLLLGISYLSQDVLGIRPDGLADLTGRNVVAVVGSGVVFGCILGFASGAFARRANQRARPATGTGEALMANLNCVVCFVIASPGLALFFTFAHFTGRTGRFEALFSPLVFFMALTSVVALGLGHQVVLSLLVGAQRSLLVGRSAIALIGLALVNATVSMVGSGLAVAIGVSFLDNGRQNFGDLWSLGAATTVMAGVAALLGVILTVGWAVPRDAPAR